MPEFDKLWDDPKKHQKRLKHWLPHWRALANSLRPKRRMRYLTLCARSMIDVFMLVREQILLLDPKSRSISDVHFCECESADYTEIEEMLGRQGSGFFGKIEDILLFEEDAFSSQFESLDEIAIKLEEEEDLEPHKLRKLRDKLTHLNVRASFPYDCINLDFCGYYYPEPPGMLRINNAVRKILEWQRSSIDGANMNVTEFLLNVTCRHGDRLPSSANARLKEIIRSNIETYEQYKVAFEASRPKYTVDNWLTKNSEDFFWSGWPKDIAASAKQFGWSTEILSCVFYRRRGPDGAHYMIACLVLKFSLSLEEPEYLPAALYALDTSKRIEIREIDRRSQQGRKLLSDLKGIVNLRNEQAQAKRRESLPLPRT
jgi:hypothetical protein